MPIYKRCSRCGRRLPEGAVCSCIKQRHREYDKYSRDRRSKQFYSSKEWEQSRNAAMQKDQGIDVYTYMTRGEIMQADTAHHIIPLKDNWEKRCDISNLMSLNHDTHSMIEQMYKKDKSGMQSQLREMLKKYRDGIKGGAV